MPGCATSTGSPTAGRDLLPVILAMVAWGDRHRAGADGPPVLVEHAGCGAPVHVEVRCADGTGSTPPAGRLRSVPGPGARGRVAARGSGG